MEQKGFDVIGYFLAGGHKSKNQTARERKSFSFQMLLLSSSGITYLLCYSVGTLSHFPSRCLAGLVPDPAPSPGPAVPWEVLQRIPQHSCWIYLIKM